MTAEIIIIGAGASGLVAAIAAGRCFLESGFSKGQDKNPVLLLERMDKPGKKILATGNGRCNLTNRYMKTECFYSESPDFVKMVLGKFGINETLDFFGELGICVKDRDGYLYPMSGQAAAVLDVLLMELRRLPAEVRTGVEIRTLKKIKGGYELLDSNGKKYTAKKVIVAGGGCASPKLGSNGTGYELAKMTGHKVITPIPALTGLYAAEKYFKKVSGVRVDARLSIYEKRKGELTLLASDQGEVQLTDYGISGIPSFQVCRVAGKALSMGKHVCAKLDFMPDMENGQLFSFLYDRAQENPHKNAEELLVGMFNRKLCTLFCELAGFKNVVTNRDSAMDNSFVMNKGSALNSGYTLPDGPALKKAIGRLVTVIKSFPADIIKTGDFEHAQVCAGGVDCRQMNEWMESKKMPGLYFVGELLDADGICGGYNLQWAWATGFIAGTHAAKR